MCKLKNRKIYRFFAVIFGLVPKIWSQQVTNLVNKFAILFKRSMFSQDCRNRLCAMSGNDSKRRRLNTCCSVFNATTFNVMLACEHSELSRASRNKMAIFLNAANSITSRLFSVTSENDWCMGRWLGVCCNSFNPPHLALLRHSLPQGARENGRSMIEMLGVLAIIGVLSVGGIAGYSKAMEKFKVNKIINEYSFMLAGIVEHADDLGRNSYRKKSGYFGEGLVDWIEGMNLVPATWHRINDIAMSDSSGNVVQWYKADNRLAVDFYLGGWQEDKSQSYSGWLDGKASASFSPKLCVDMFESLVQPMHHVLYEANTFNSKQSGKGVVFLGDSICGSENKKCLSAAKLADFHQACQVCDATGVCAITLWFQL